MTKIPLHGHFDRMFNTSKINTEDGIDALIEVMEEDIKKNGVRTIILKNVKFVGLPIKRR